MKPSHSPDILFLKTILIMIILKHGQMSYIYVQKDTPGSYGLKKEYH